MNWYWILLGIGGGILTVLLIGWITLYHHINSRLYPHLLRIFQEKPLFIIPRGQPIEDAEDISFTTDNGLTLKALYLRTPAEQRLGVILFGLEYGSNRWACVSYCQFLREAGFDIFTFEPRSQGESDKQEGYEPLQWVTDFEVRDMKAALNYLRSRPDADDRGFGFFGLSKGGSAGLLAAIKEPSIRCFVTDGAFATHTTMVPYMRKWIAIYSTRLWLQKLLPDWYYLMFAIKGLRHIEKERKCHFPHLEYQMHRLAPRPLLMIHGGADNYIKPEMAQALFDRAQQPKELWVIEGAKHNQAFHVANGEYKRRVLAFFQSHLAVYSREPDRKGKLAAKNSLSPITADQA